MVDTGKKKIRILICDENSDYSSHLELMIRNDFPYNCRKIEWEFEQVRCEKEFSKCAAAKFWNIVLMDVSFAGNGIEIIKKKKEYLKKTVVIFMSDEWKRVTEAYDVPHLTYILKKNMGTYLLPSIEKIVEQVWERNGRMRLEIKGGLVLIKPCEICYIERKQRKTIIFTEDEVFYSTQKMDELEKCLDEDFVRCHNSYIANLYKIKRYIHGELELENEIRIPVSRRYQKGVLEKLCG